MGQSRLPRGREGDRQEAGDPRGHHYRRASLPTYICGRRPLTAASQVCTAFLALSLRAEGYTVFANSDASGTFDAKTALDANDRMRAAGVQVLSLFAVACELMRDWRNTPGAKELLPFFDTYAVSSSMSVVVLMCVAGIFPSMVCWRARTMRRSRLVRFRACRLRIAGRRSTNDGATESGDASCSSNSSWEYDAHIPMFLCLACQK